MEDMIATLGNKLAKSTSRRGFFGTVGKIALGGGAALAGLGAFSVGTALAADCCSNPNNCGSYSCPGVSFPCTQAPYQSYYCCASNPTQYWLCENCCVTSGGSQVYVCSYNEVVSQNCPNTVAHH